MPEFDMNAPATDQCGRFRNARRSVREVMRRAGAADIAERSNVLRNGSVDTGMSQRLPLGGNPTARDSFSQHEPGMGQQDDTTLRSGRVVGTAPALEITEEPAIPRATLQASALTPEPTGDAAAGTGTQRTAFPSGRPDMVGGMQQVTTRAEGRSSAPSVVRKPQLSAEPDVGLARTSASVDGDLSSRAASRPDASSSAEKAQQTSETGLVGDPLIGTPLEDDPYDDAFRSDYDARYANTGAPYDESRRAYTHGAALGQDERYRGQEVGTD
ncbi:hypothetical protein [Caballeronia arvi]|nr:hypothetical protein [Caballeronia arvi]